VPDSFETRLKKLEKQQAIGEVPQVDDIRQLKEALILPQYFVPKYTPPFLQEVLNKWEKKMGKKEFAFYCKSLLTDLDKHQKEYEKLIRSRPENLVTTETKRMKAIQQASKQVTSR